MTFSDGFSLEIFASTKVKDILFKLLPLQEKFQKTSIDFNFTMFLPSQKGFKVFLCTCWVPRRPVMSSLNVHTQTKPCLGNWCQELLCTNFVVWGFTWLLTWNYARLSIVRYIPSPSIVSLLPDFGTIHYLDMRTVVTISTQHGAVWVLVSKLSTMKLGAKEHLIVLHDTYLGK